MWVGIIIALVIISLLLWQFFRNYKIKTRTYYTYDIYFKKVGYNANYDHKVVVGHDPIEALKSLGIKDPKLVTKWHDARYEVIVENTLVGYYM